ncbi:glycosyltransferase family 2 protein [Thalassospiraceae bacterium LMO-SO8]|nr:glycosyltransferase [Alphaproteobacteria bacterium LMO-S08]WND76155.1 glycosyltransferase family 2 protein [Thalassospiraceae bacterium LMO-SO8]
MKNVLAAALVAAVLHGLAWATTLETAALPDVTGKVHSMSFNIGAPREVWFGRSATLRELANALDVIKPVSRSVRTYTVSGIQAQVPALAKERGIEVMLGIWLGRDDASNRREIETAVALVRKYSNIRAVFVGNETLLREDLTLEELIAIIREVRTRVPVPVTTGETWDRWLSHPDLVDEVDFMSIHVLPYWEAVGAQNAVSYAFERYREVLDTFPGKDAIIAEFGWPSRGYRNRDAGPDPMTQATIIRKFVSEASRHGIGYNLMEAFDQPWKTMEGSVGPYWGVFDHDGNAKFSLAGAVEQPEQWRRGILALILGLVMTVLWLMTRRPTFGHALAMAIAANALAAAVAVALLYPFENYLNVGSAIAWSLGMVLMLPLTLVTLGKLDEVAEVTLGPRPKRLWRTENAPADAPLPKVSIQIPAYRENPEMLIETLNSCAALDYPDFEVVVIINNTADESLWRPVQAHCVKLGPRFKFLNFPKIDGFKAGALTAAMAHVAEDAAVLALIDADYVVDPNWLKDLVPAFADPKVAMVQAPQDHRDGERSLLARCMNAEYTGFFDIGMVQRNEADAIIAHGTMLLVRRAAFDAVGGWSPDTITEDTELGLRLFEAGYHAHYTRRRYGWGLLPDTYRAFKTQRHRWAYGAVQIFFKHWRHMLPGAKTLTRAQKVHYVTGWLHWLSDSVGALAAVVNLAWVPFILFVGVMLPPIPFTLPILAAFAAGLLHCVLLYAARVKIGPARIAGAALAAASLQWTVARAIYDGIKVPNLPFQVTQKGKAEKTNAPAVKAAPASPVRTETRIGLALMTSSAALFAVNTTGIVELYLFAGTLLVQSLPFLAATAMYALERRDAARLTRGKAAIGTRNPAMNVGGTADQAAA